MNPTEFDDHGIYKFGLSTCVTYMIDGSSGTTDVKCAQSDQFIVTIDDPCVNA